MLLAHPGTQYAPRLAAELHKRDLLLRYWTASGIAEGSSIDRVIGFLPSRAQKPFRNRLVRGIPQSQVRTIPLLELACMARMRIRVGGEAALCRRNAVFQQRVSAVDIDASRAVIGFDTSSWILAERCRQANTPLVLDQSIGHPLSKERVYRDLRARYLDWGETFSTKANNLLEHEREEHVAAAAIVVASSFTRKSLVENGVDESKIVTNPYGVDFEQFRPTESEKRSRPLRFLFVGLVNARKGVPLLLEAWRALQRRSDAELWIVGAVAESVRPLIPKLPGLRLFEPRPHDELPELFRECDVFVFPSFFEGFGLVLLEAMACGLPIIASDATAAPDLVSRPEHGIVTDSGSLDQLISAIQSFVDRPDQLPIAARAARARAEEFSWDVYGQRWASLIGRLG